MYWKNICKIIILKIYFNFFFNIYENYYNFFKNVKINIRMRVKYKYFKKILIKNVKENEIFFISEWKLDMLNKWNWEF